MDEQTIAQGEQVSYYVLLLDIFMDERLYPCTCKEQTGGLYTVRIGRYEGSERYLAWGHAGEWVGTKIVLNVKGTLIGTTTTTTLTFTVTA